jgi:hypothetical protein
MATQWRESIRALVMLFGALFCSLVFAKETTAIGSLCVLSPDTFLLDEILAAASQSNALVKRSPGNDGACQNRYAGGKDIEVPAGLEAWTLNLLVKLGYRVGYNHGTAGGSGPIEDAPIEPDSVFAEALTAGSLDRVSRVTFCRIKSRLSDYFPEIEVTKCGDAGFKNGLCRFFWIGGHISKSPGFHSLARIIGGRYWISAKVAIDIGNFTNIIPNDGRHRDGMVIIRVTTMRSVYALMPPDRKPEPDRYHPIENDIPNLDVDDLDTRIALEVQSILSKVPPLRQVTCDTT